MGEKIDIAICYHKPSMVFQSDALKPMQLGKAEAKIDLGFRGDDTGDNISAKNKYYAEDTAFYWLWKNSAADIKGILHLSAALYTLSPRIMDYIEDEIFADFGKDIFPFVIKKGEKLRAYATPEYIKDMGTKDRLDEVSRDLLSGKVQRYNRINKRPTIFLDCDGVINKDMEKNISIDNIIVKLKK
jgi:hypothetical protein